MQRYNIFFIQKEKKSFFFNDIMIEPHELRKIGEDRAVEYLTFPQGVRTIAVRLTILGTTEDITVGMSGFRIFGENLTLALEHNRYADY